MGESVNVTARVADQLRSLRGFDRAQFRPRSDAPVGDSIMIADRAIVVVLSPARWALVRRQRRYFVPGSGGCSFTEVASQLRPHIFNNYNDLSTPAARGVMSEMVNHDLRLWLHELVCTRHHGYITQE